MLSAGLPGATAPVPGPQLSRSHPAPRPQDPGQLFQTPERAAAVTDRAGDRDNRGPELSTDSQ